MSQMSTPRDDDELAEKVTSPKRGLSLSKGVNRPSIKVLPQPDIKKVTPGEKNDESILKIDPETDQKRLDEYLGNEVDDFLNTGKDEGENEDPGEEVPL